MKKLIHLLSVLIFVGASTLTGFFAAAGVSACLYGAEITQTVVGDPVYREHPAYILWNILLIPFGCIGAIGTLFGIIIPINLWLRCPIEGNPKLLRVWLHRYANAIAAATTPDP